VSSPVTLEHPVPGSAAARPRVLHVGKYYPPYRGGIETHLHLLCTGLRACADVEVIVASDDRLDAEEWIDGVKVLRVGTRFTLAGAPVCPGMVRLIRESAADIVHLHLPNPAAVLAYLASGHRGKLVVSYHSDVVRQRVLDTAFRPFLNRFLDRTDTIISATPNYIDSSPVLTRYRDRCEVIPYGIPLDSYARDSASAAEIRARYGERLVVSVGRLVYYKGFQPLVDAMREVDGRLLIIGDGPLRTVLEARVRAHGLQDRVSILSGVADVAPYYQAADVFVLASIARSEAFGIVQLEAMACGTPVVNTGLDSGVPYVSRDGESGLTVPPRQPAALAAAINRLLGDAELRERFGRAARDRVEREFSTETMVSRTLELYRDVLAGGSPAGRARGAARPLRTHPSDLAEDRAVAG
jgi:glycosyltransferase involved in cell wall biosynthesis